MKRNYIIYHLHSDKSLLDSCTHYKEYIKKAKELGMKAIGFSEHGNIYNWIDKKMYCDEMGIKYIHGCEVYLTEKLYNVTIDDNGKEVKSKIRDNYHTVLIAKNMEGLRELNLLVGQATDKDHKYYKPRITFDEFLGISDNIIKISACLASPLCKLSEDNPYYEKLLLHYDFYEIQYHNVDSQKEYNKKLYRFSKKYNKPLIVGTDTHSLNDYKAECRNILKKAKKMEYEDEDKFDLTFKSYNELVEMFKIQNSLDIDVVLQAIENTNMLYDLCEDIVLDKSIKYPRFSDNDENLFIKKTINMFKHKVEKSIIPKDKLDIYKNRLKEEISVFRKLDMCSFMLSMSDIIMWCKASGIPVGYCRGSVGGSLVAYVLDIIDVDPIVWKTVFSRFANEDRLEVGDIDVDISPTQRELVYNHIIETFGYDKSAYVLAITTISDKGTIDDIGRALSEKWKENNEEYQKELQNIRDKYKACEGNGLAEWSIDTFGWDRLEHINKENNPYTLSNIADIKKEYDENPEETRKKYPDIFYYFDGLVNTAIAESMHPAGMVISPITLPDNIGCFWNKNNQKVLYINMDEIHDGCGLVKYDILGLKNIEIIKDTCELIGIPYPKSYEFDWNDEDVWKHITDSPVGIFQFEGDYAYDLLNKYQPRKINDLSLVNACLRPSGESYRDRLIAKEFNHNPSEIIDNLLKQNNGFLVFQEDTIAFLQQICGLSGSDADNIRRAIGRKDKERLDKAMPSILEGYCAKSPKARKESEKEAKEFLQIIEDSSSYQFGYNHSTGYSMIGYTCGYFRYHYPLEFTCAYLNNATTESDISSGTELANLLDIKINPPKFRYSRSTYMMDKSTNSIYKGISSIKFLNSTVAEELYSLRDLEFSTFTDLLRYIMLNTSANFRQIRILTSLNYFSEFGKNKKLLDIIDLYEKKLKNKSLKEKTVETRLKELYEYEKSLEDKSLGVKEQIKDEIEYLGYPSSKKESLPDNVYIIIKTDEKSTIKVDLYRLKDGVINQYKVLKKDIKNNEPFGCFNVLKLQGYKTKPKRKKIKEVIDGETKEKWVLSDETESYMTRWQLLIRE